MEATVNDIIKVMDGIAPPNLAEPWDNVGLLVGRSSNTVKKLMVALDVSPEVVEQAVEHKVQMLVTHHPVIFDPIKKMTDRSWHVIEAGPCVVTQVKTVEKDGYEAVQLGFQDKKEKHTTKPLMGHFKKARVTPKKHLAEFKEFETELNLGDTVTVELFNDATFVDVVGTSKGKGFQGVVKRHGFGGVGQTTHGQHNRARKPGSIGACSYPAKVFKGMRMGGQLGGDRVTVQNLQVLKVIAEHNLLLIKGSVPGCKGSIVIIEK